MVPETSFSDSCRYRHCIDHTPTFVESFLFSLGLNFMDYFQHRSAKAVQPATHDYFSTAVLSFPVLNVNAFRYWIITLSLSYCIFNDAFSNPHYTASKYTMTNEQRTGEMVLGLLHPRGIFLEPPKKITNSPPPQVNITVSDSIF